MNIFHALVALPDAYLQLTVPSFEFPRRDLPASVRFVGALPIIPNQAPLPPWADELDGSRKVVLVTQGTVANYDFGQLVVPTLAALANEPDVLVVVTAGGRSIDAIPGPIPSNARLASYLPFEWLLPKGRCVCHQRWLWQRQSGSELWRSSCRRRIDRRQSGHQRPRRVVRRRHRSRDQ